MVHGRWRRFFLSNLTSCNPKGPVVEGPKLLKANGEKRVESDGEVLPPKPRPPGLDQFFVLMEFVHIDGATGR